MKKILALFLSMLMLLSSVSVFANPVGFKEVIEYDTNEYVTDDIMAILYKLGIATSWPDVNSLGKRHAEVMPRWFLTFWLQRMNVLKVSSVKGFETMYTDLTSEHKYYKTIKAAVEQGFMTGYPDGTFRAGETTSTMVAAEALLKALGYDPYIKVFGMQRAFDQTRILEGVPIKDAITQDIMMRMIYNALMSPAIKEDEVKKTANGEFDVTYVIDQNYLGFEHLYGLKYYVGVVDGVKGSTLHEGTYAINDGKVFVSGVEYAYSEDVSELLGYKVNYLYKESKDGEKEIFYIFKSDKNEEFVLTHDVIDSYSNGVYSYADGNKTKEVSLDARTMVIYNGIANPNYSLVEDEENGTKNEMVPDFGSVTFINNDGKKGYDVVKIVDYDFMFCSSILSAENKIYDLQGETPKILDVSEVDEIKVWNEDKEITFDRIRKSNLLVIKRSSPNSGYDKMNIEIFKASNKSFRPTAVREDSIQSAGAKHAAWKKVTKNLEIGSYYNLYKYNGVVVYVVEETLTGFEHAYLVDVIETGSFREKGTIFSLIDTEGDKHTFEGAKIVFIDGKRYDNTDKMCIAIQESAELYSNGYSEDFPFSQPVKIAFNSDGQINKIDTYAKGTGEESNLQVVEKARNVEARYAGSSKSFYVASDSAQKQFNDLVASVDPSSTNIIFVPSDRNEEAGYYSKVFSSSSKHTIDVAGIDPDIYIAETIYAYYNPKEPDITNIDPFIISDLTEELNEEGDVVYGVKGYCVAKFYEYTCDKELFEELGVGDIWRFEVDKLNHIVAHDLVLDIDEVPEKEDRSGEELHSH